MRYKLYLIGIGPGAEEYMLPVARRVIESSDVLIGGSRNLQLFNNLDKEKMVIGNNLQEVCQYITDNLGIKKITVLASGDPGLYSIMGYLNKNLQNVDIEVISGISSLQYLCSKLKLSWNDMYITSLHGRSQDDFISKVRSSRKVCVFTGGSCGAENVCNRLVENGLGHLTVTVGENLSYPNERIITGTPEEISKRRFGSLSIMIIENNTGIFNESKKVWEYEAPGIPDEVFVRGSVPMTKQEVRAVSVSKLRLCKGSTVYDIGAGTGSVTVECALRCKKGIVYAIERSRDGLELISRNVKKFKLNNVNIVEGEAPSALINLPEPDRVFIGGSGGNMEGILDWVKGTSRPVRVVANAVTVESVYEAIKGLEKRGFDNIEAVSVAVSRSRKAGSNNLMEALNTVYIISADKI